SMEVDDGLSLVQHRSHCVDVPMPICFRQYEDVLPEPPPSVPSHAAQQPVSILPKNSLPARACSSAQAAPFCTAKNIFGLVHQFLSSTPPCHNPKEAIMLQNISYIPTVSPDDSHVKSDNNSFHPYSNESSFKLGHWYLNGSIQKSHQSFKELLDIMGCSEYDPDNVWHIHWEKINSQLGAGIDDEGDEWEDDDAGWHKTQVTIDVPFSQTNVQPGTWPYVAANLYHRSLVSVIQEKLANAHNDEHFHYEPYHLRWSPPPPNLPHEVNIQGELYMSPAFIDAHRELQELPREAGCDLPHVAAALMFWSDATQLTMFGNAKLWPVYMYFGNELKYRQCRPSCNLGNHVAYFQKLPDLFKDFVGIYTEGKGVGRECTMHFHREMFQAQWKVLLDDKFLEAYEHGIVILCCDGVKRRFYPQIFTCSADYPEKVLVATIQQLGGCPCLRCLIPTNRLHQLGMVRDRQQRATLTHSNHSRSQLIATTHNLIYEKHYGVDSTVIELLLKPESWVPTSMSMPLKSLSLCSLILDQFGFDVFVALVVDLLHKFELGVWHMLLVHLLRILTALNKDLVHELDRRYRQVPPFGPATIRRFSSNTSEMSNMAAQNFEDLLQCSIPVFDDLLANNHHNKIVIDLLFMMSHWHGLAKLCMHSDLTLDILNQQTTDLGEQFRLFKDKVCPSYQTQELDREVGARSCWQAKEVANRGENDVPGPKQPQRKKSFNFSTYKFHVLGDYATSIHYFGTTDSYSTEPGELEHCTPKGGYHRTDQRSFVCQLTQIEHCEAHLCCIKQWQWQQVPHADVPEMASDPQVQHHIGQSEKMYDKFGQYLCKHAGDPAIKDFLPRLKEHILNCLKPETPSEQHNSILFKRNRIYHHNLARFNYTTYDVRRAQDVINPRTPHCNIMLLKNDCSDDEHGGDYSYAKVISIHHVNVVCMANEYKSRRIEFLLVRWYESVQNHAWDTHTLGCIHFRPLANQNAFGFMDPRVVLRVCHIIPAFARGQRNLGECGISPLAGNKLDWCEYYINR
ncbi:hypothetical protein BDR05DRAFT_891592, partial [Suillus weaverae]